MIQLLATRRDTADPAVPGSPNRRAAATVDIDVPRRRHPSWTFTAAGMEVICTPPQAPGPTRTWSAGSVPSAVNAPSGYSYSVNGTWPPSWLSMAVTTIGTVHTDHSTSDRRIRRPRVVDLNNARVQRRPILGGLINEYSRAA
jgi:hypothetical protein